MKKCTQLANSSFKLCTLYLTSTEYTAISEVGTKELHYCHSFLFGKKRHFMGLGPGFLGC